MKKQKLSEGIVDKIYKLLSIGKYNQVQKNFKGNKKVQNAIKKSEIARKELIKAMEEADKKTGFKSSGFKSRLMKSVR